MSSLEKFNEKDADVWNSKAVESEQFSFVSYAGMPHKTLQTYFWKSKILHNE